MWQGLDEPPTLAGLLGLLGFSGVVLIVSQWMLLAAAQRPMAIPTRTPQSPA